MNTIQLALEKVKAADYQEDLVGYVFMFLLIGSVIVGYFFWYFACRDYYPGTSDVKTNNAAGPETNVKVDIE